MAFNDCVPTGTLPGLALRASILCFCLVPATVGCWHFSNSGIYHKSHCWSSPSESRPLSPEKLHLIGSMTVFPFRQPISSSSFFRVCLPQETYNKNKYSESPRSQHQNKVILSFPWSPKTCLSTHQRKKWYGYYGWIWFHNVSYNECWPTDIQGLTRPKRRGSLMAKQVPSDIWNSTSNGKLRIYM